MCHTTISAAATALALTFGSTALGSTLLVDDFNGAVIDPAWTLSFANNTAGWTFGIGGGTLAVTDISPLVFPPGCDVSGAPWADVILDRPFSPAGDFACEAAVSWDSANSIKAMQRIAISVLDCHGANLGFCSMTDAWVGSSGSKVSLLGDHFAFSGAGSVPLAGNAILRLERTGTSWTAKFNGTPIDTFAVAGVPQTLRITFSYYASHLCSGGDTIFGSESIDWIQVEGDPGVHPVGDLTGDGDVNGFDITVLLGLWGTDDCSADIDHSGQVDGLDITYLLGSWTG